jgi:hypothetical protein
VDEAVGSVAAYNSSCISQKMASAFSPPRVRAYHALHSISVFGEGKIHRGCYYSWYLFTAHAIETGDHVQSRPG